MAIQCAGIILSGGQSTRMGGRPKGLLRIGRRSFLDRIAIAIEACTQEVLLVTRDPCHYGDWPHRIVEDIFTMRSPLAGIHAGLVHMRADYAFFSSCDTPFLKSDVIRTLIAYADDESDIVVPSFGTYYQPLCAVYSKACAWLIESQLSRGDLKVDHLFSMARVKAIPYEQFHSVDPELKSFFNVNTPSDFKTAALMLDDAVAPVAREP